MLAAKNIFHILLWAILASSPFTSSGQIIDSTIRRVTDFYTRQNFDSVFNLDKFKFRNFEADSIFKEKFTTMLSTVKTSPSLPFFSKSDFSPIINTVKKKNREWIQFGGGFLNYQWNYRSGIDTPFLESNLSQHLLTANVQMTIADVLPLKVTYVERQSNSSFFQDFRDFRVDLDINAMRQRGTEVIRGKLKDKLYLFQDPGIGSILKSLKGNLSVYRELLSDTRLQTALIEAKEIIRFPELIDTMSQEIQAALMQSAKEFVVKYDQFQSHYKRLEVLSDSMQLVYDKLEKEYRTYSKLVNGNLNDPNTMDQLNKLLADKGLSPGKSTRVIEVLSGFKALSFGRTQPNYTNLTLRNMNVRGINLEYNKRNIYAAFTTGSVDFRVRDFVYSNQMRAPQFIIAARAGYGSKEGNHLIATYYEGERQLYPSVTTPSVQRIKGISIAGQLIVAKYHRISAEIAQSATPNLFLPGSTGTKANLNLNDADSRAYSIQLRSYIPVSRTKFEAMYSQNGVNFQSFTQYRANAAQRVWNLRLDQAFWRRRIQLTAGLRQNDFFNPLLTQRYEANMVFKNINLVFRNRNWPSLTIGYMPGSQLTIIDSIVYENYYQTLNFSALHTYKIGTATASSSIVFNRFYNDSRDSGFIYYNANNYMLSQIFRFEYYSATINYNHTESGLYNLDVCDVGFLFPIGKKHNAGGGLKFNVMNTMPGTQVGFYVNSRFVIPSVGEFVVWMESSFLPNQTRSLTRNELYNVGFTRYFHAKKN